MHIERFNPSRSGRQRRTLRHGNWTSLHVIDAARSEPAAGVDGSDSGGWLLHPGRGAASAWREQRRRLARVDRLDVRSCDTGAGGPSLTTASAASRRCEANRRQRSGACHLPDQGRRRAADYHVDWFRITVVNVGRPSPHRRPARPVVRTAASCAEGQIKRSTWDKGSHLSVPIATQRVWHHRPRQQLKETVPAGLVVTLVAQPLSQDRPV